MRGAAALRLAVFIGLCLLATVAALIPLGAGGGLMPPDLLFGLVLAWALRAPDPLPVWALVALGLFGDVMLSRPIGLGALGLLLAAEAMRRVAPRLRGTPFPLEWATAAALFALMLGCMQIALRIALADTPPASDLARYLVATVIAYPAAALAASAALGRRRAGSAA